MKPQDDRVKPIISVASLQTAYDYRPLYIFLLLVLALRHASRPQRGTPAGVSVVDDGVYPQETLAVLEKKKEFALDE